MLEEWLVLSKSNYVPVYAGRRVSAKQSRLCPTGYRLQVWHSDAEVGL